MAILLILNDAGLARTSLNGDEPMLCAWGNDDDDEWVMMTNDGDAATATHDVLRGYRYGAQR